MRGTVAAAVSATVWFLLYYSSLRLLPPTSVIGANDSSYPGGRFDLADFLGSLLWPPIPTHQTWLIGIIALVCLLSASAVGYFILLSWSLSRSTVEKGIAYGLGVFAVTGLMVWLANGYHPAVMRGALADTGFYLLGWSGWATLQLCATFVVHGGVLGWLYRTDSSMSQ
ncbi:hypothetical protein CCAX7_61250 [Capsulimonas corticalis]|uniref:Transmembrane protein n=2 Tax=Capsulimonas corticalis TaxID=2219043 RepID=A0A9N7QD25_9BACT|nr:hypothetical protein CCAX7_61250 [Capsulimonas corticalis]